jgi:putative transposase
MARKRYKPEEIVAKLRQVDVLVSQGQNMVDAIRQIGVSEVTYYRWRQEFGGLKSEQVKRLKDLELESSRLRKAVCERPIPGPGIPDAAGRELHRQRRHAGEEFRAHLRRRGAAPRQRRRAACQIRRRVRLPLLRVQAPRHFCHGRAGGHFACFGEGESY